MGKKLKKLPEYLTAEEANKLFSVISLPRDRFMLQCCYYFGLRVSELIGLKHADFNLKERVLTVRAENSKGKKERRVPIPESFFQTVKQYLSFVGAEASLFGIGRHRVFQLVKHYAGLAGITKNVHPHTLRHSYATAVYQHTGDLRLVQSLLGHASLNTSAIYSHLDDESKRRGITGCF